MSKISVQCKGSGQRAKAGISAKKTHCHWCAKWVEVASNGNLRKHKRETTTAKLRKSKTR